MTMIRVALDAALRGRVPKCFSIPALPAHVPRVLWASALLLGAGMTVQAQTPPATSTTPSGGSGERAAALDEITVTGSRIKHANDFDVATPTTVVDAAYLQNLNLTNVGEALTQLPSNVSTFTPATTGNSSFFAGSVIPNLRGLNPYFGSRTLTLVDGQRFVPTNQGDGLDLNFIPSVLIDHMDVVTGGASAACHRNHQVGQHSPAGRQADVQGPSLPQGPEE